MRPRREVWLAGDVEMALGWMALEDRDYWAARIERLAARGPGRGARKLRGSRDLYRLEARGWTLLFRCPARGRRVTLASLRQSRLEEVVDELLGRA